MGISMKRAVIALIPSEEQRSAVRRVVSLSAQLVPCGAHLRDAVVFDISTKGFKASVHGEVAVGLFGWVQLPGLTPVACKTVWAKDGDVGFAFLEPISEAMIGRVSESGPRSWPKGHFGARAA